MPVIADTHVHIYPCYNAPRALQSARENLRRLAIGMSTSVTRVLCLTERHDCHVFRDWSESPPNLPTAAGHIAPTAEADALVHIDAEGTPMYLVAGRQIVTSERLEVLALTTDAAIADGKPIDEAIAAVGDAGGIPVLPWAPGKWLGGRGKVIRRLIEAAEPGSLLVGDTSLRPTIYPEPLLMRLARRRGLTMIAGSDPLPFTGDDRVTGSYATILDGDFDADQPVSSLRAILASPLAARIVGRRSGPFDVLRRLRGNARSKTGAQP